MQRCEEWVSHRGRRYLRLVFCRLAFSRVGWEDLMTAGLVLSACTLVVQEAHLEEGHRWISLESWEAEAVLCPAEE